MYNVSMVYTHTSGVVLLQYEHIVSVRLTVYNTDCLTNSIKTDDENTRA